MIKVSGDNLAVSDCLERYRDELEDFFVVSSVIVNGTLPADPTWIFEQAFSSNEANGTVTVLPPLHHKCPRCWKYNTQEEDRLCERCDEVVASTS